MNRREFLTYGLVFAAGAGLSAAVYQQTAAPIDPASDLERQLIQMVRPDAVALRDVFPQFPHYDATIGELTARGLVYRGGLNMNAIENHRESDPILEFAGWQYLETELLVLLAAHQLAGSHLSVAPQGENKLTFKHFEVFDGIDAAGEAIATYRIDGESDYAALTTCITLCEQEESCTNITLGKAEHPVIGKQNMCWLTDDNVTRSPSPYYFSARRK